MTYLVFYTLAAAEAALALINSRYGCEYTAENGYTMTGWDTVKKAATEDKWYFVKPEARLGKVVPELIIDIAPDEEIATLPAGWVATGDV